MKLEFDQIQLGSVIMIELENKTNVPFFVIQKKQRTIPRTPLLKGKKLKDVPKNFQVFSYHKNRNCSAILNRSEIKGLREITENERKELRLKIILAKLDIIIKNILILFKKIFKPAK